MIVALVVAATDNGVIGRANALPWRLPADLRHFRKVTGANPLIMGRKTHESIGRALPGRRNIVITRQHRLTLPGCDVVHSLSDAVELARSQNPPEACVIGGGEVFREAMPIADRIYLTRVHAEVEGDAHFPSPSEQQWKETSREDHATNAENPFAYSFILLERR
jgi:dihydrofolate reductase